MADANEPPAPKVEQTTYRSVVMRASYLSQDSPDLSEAVKTLARYMKPSAFRATQKVRKIPQEVSITEECIPCAKDAQEH